MTTLLQYPRARQGDYVIPDSVVEIGARAFKHCQLTSVTIPNSVTRIGNSAFAYSDVSTLTIPDSVVEIGSHAFYNSSLSSVHIPNSITRIRQSTFCESSLTSVIIPDSVVEIGGNAFRECRNLTSVIITASVVEIEDRAFMECPALTSVVIPDSVTKIGFGAFADCTSLTSVTIPASVVEIGKCAFSDCSAFFTVHPDNSFYTGEDGKLFNKDKTELLYPFQAEQYDDIIDFNEEEVVPDSVVKKKKRIKSFKFPKLKFSKKLKKPDCEVETDPISYNENYTVVSLSSQINNQKMKIDNQKLSVELTSKIRLGKALKNAGIKDVASVAKLTVAGRLYKDDFRYINKNMRETLQELDLGNTLAKEIRIFDLDDCSALTSIVFPASAVKFSRTCFRGHANFRYLTTITVHPDNPVFTSRDGILFNKNMSVLEYCPRGRQESYVMPDTVRKIVRNAFAGCTGLTSITISASVEEIEKCAFLECSTLTSVDIPASVTCIPSYAFKDCCDLTSVLIPDSVTDIGDSAFSGCMELKTINIPDSVIEIRKRAFSDCTGLTSFTIPTSVRKIEDWTFDGCTGLTSVFIPASVVEIDKEAFEGCYAYISVHPANPVYKSENGKLTKKKK
jgi:hypothetical protein